MLYTILQERHSGTTRAQKAVTIHSFDITAINLPVVEFKVVCSTERIYEVLANDFGAALGCGAYSAAYAEQRFGEFEVRMQLAWMNLCSSWQRGDVD